MGPALTALALGAALTLAGAGFGSPSLLIPGFGLAGLAIGSVVWVQLARPRRLEREPGPARIIEGEAYPLCLRAPGMRVPPPGGELRDPLLSEPVAVGPRWRGLHRAEVRLTGRGRRRLQAAELELRDPLGLCRARVRSEEAGELLVLPRIEPVAAIGTGAGGAREAALGGLDQAGVSARPDPRAIELEVDGLRAYREGSPASRIHWPAVARTGELVERRLVAGGDAAPLVALDASAPAGDEELDAAVRAAGSLCVALSRMGGCAVLLGGDRRTTELDAELRGWPQVHARLALIESGGPPPAIARASRAGDVFWVTASPRPALPASLRGPGAARRWLVVPAEHAARATGAARFTVAGCEGRLTGARARVARAA